jgi:hypothetical protein
VNGASVGPSSVRSAVILMLVVVKFAVSGRGSLQYHPLLQSLVDFVQICYNGVELTVRKYEIRVARQ